MLLKASYAVIVKLNATFEVAPTGPTTTKWVAGPGVMMPVATGTKVYA